MWTEKRVFSMSEVDRRMYDTVMSDRRQERVGRGGGMKTNMQLRLFSGM